MKFPWTLIAITAICCLMRVTQTTARPSVFSTDYETLIEETNDEVIKERISHISLPICAPYNAEVKEFIKRYVVLGTKESEGMLGRTSLYFPIFEHYLRVYQLPEELKYLPMVESTLRPDVRSAAGAAGLWQFVPASGRHFGLKMDNYVDERMDPYRSTEAAVKMLSTLYKQFGDWSLVLVAFNCGPGRVQKAMHAARSTDYWEIKKYLPQESRQYVPAFIAAAYLVNYYGAHGLDPNFPSYQLQETRTFRVYTPLSFSEIAQACNVKMSVLQTLNPSYLQRYVPASQKGNFVVVPASASSALRKLIIDRTGSKVDRDAPEDSFKTSYLVMPGDRIETVALLLQCKVEDLMKWNQLAQKEIVVNQHLMLYLPNKARTVKP